MYDGLRILYDALFIFKQAARLPERQNKSAIPEIADSMKY
jgi:hypothetical protein